MTILKTIARDMFRCLMFAVFFQLMEVGWILTLVHFHGVCR